MMQNHLKTRSQTACLFAFCCVLLVSSFLGLQHAPLAHAASLQTARAILPERSNNCQPPQCNPFPYHDLYVFTSNAVWGFNAGSFDPIDDGNIGLTNAAGTSGQFGTIQAVIARGNTVYEWRMIPQALQTINNLFAVVHGGCTTSTGYCLTLLDNNPDTFLVSAGTSGLGLYQEHGDGTVWQLTGVCLFCWQKIDTNATHDLVASDHVYETRIDGTVWRYNGTPNNWTEVNGPSQDGVTLAIDTLNVLYELDSTNTSSSVLQGEGPFNFQAIDTLDQTSRIIANQRLYQRSSTGILLYEGGTLWGSVPLSNGATDVEPGDASDAVYWERSDNSFLQYTPENGTSEILSSDPGLKMAQPEWAFYKL